MRSGSEVSAATRTADATVLRPLHWTDLPAVLELEERAFPADAWPASSWWAELAARPARQYVVITGDPSSDGALLGYAGVRWDGEVADVMTVAVAPEARGAGLGRRLMDELLRISEQWGAARVLLEVRSDNPAAIELYRSLGFDQIHRRPGYYRAGADTPAADAIVMSSEAGRLGAPEGDR